MRTELNPHTNFILSLLQNFFSNYCTLHHIKNWCGGQFRPQTYIL